MPRYCWKCENCGKEITVVRPVAQRNVPDFAKCEDPDCFGCVMQRDIQAEHSAVRGDYQQSIVSISMAFDSQDLAEHRRRFPDVELQVDHPGRTAYPVLKSLSQKKRYLKGRGMQDMNAWT